MSRVELTVVVEDRITVDLGGGKSVTWRIGADVPKPFIHPVTLGGFPVTLASPHDHVHHRGIMFAMKVDGVNYWEEGDGPEFGIQRVTAVDAVTCSRERVSFALEIEWIHRFVQIRETRWFAVEGEKEGILITWRSRLVPAGGESVRGVELSGKTPYSTVSYYGLGVRFPRSMDIAGEHRNACGRRGVEETHGTRAAWHDYSGRLDENGSVVGITVFDHPRNPRHPTEWFTMDRPFAYVSASFVATKTYALIPGEPLELTYGLWAHDGRPSMQEIDAVYLKWSASNGR